MLIDLHEIAELYEYERILTESARIDFLVKTYANQLDKINLQSSISSQVDMNEISGMPGETLGEQLVYYISNFDPTNNKQYSQWLIQRFIKGFIKLEDMYRASEYLTIFQRTKSKLNKKDINQYQNFVEIYQAIEPFLKGDQDVSKSAQRKRMKSDDNVDVLFDSDDLLVLIPKNKESAIFWGRGTQWCTATTIARNYFEAYNKRGPLYIIIDRKTNEKFQFHFEDEQFMDYQDNEINLRDFVLRHPNIINIIGRDKFLKVWKQLGLGFLTPYELNSIPLEQLAEGLSADLSYFFKLPDYIKNNQNFALLLVLNGARLGNNTKEAKKILSYLDSQNLLNDDLLKHSFITSFITFGLLPPKYHTEEYKKMFFEKSFNTKHTSKWYESYIPKPWPDVISEHYWLTKCGEITIYSLFDYKDIPNDFFTDNIKIQYLRLTGEVLKIPASGHSAGVRKKASAFVRDLANEISDEILVNAIKNNFSIFFTISPTRIKMSENIQASVNSMLADKIFAVSDYIVSYMGLTGFLGTSSKEVFYGNWFSQISIHDTYDRILADAFGSFPIRFSQLSEDQKTSSLFIDYITSPTNAQQLKLIPEKYWTTEAISAFVKQNKYYLNELPSYVLSEEYLLNNPAIVVNSIWEHIPKKSKTQKVIEKYCAEGLIPFDKLPKYLRNIDTFERSYNFNYRNKYNRDFIASIPSDFITPLNLIEMVNIMDFGHSLALLDQVNDSVLSPPLLNAFLTKASDFYQHKTNIDKIVKRFPKVMWTEETYEIAISKGLHPPIYSQLPDLAKTIKVARQILRKDASQLGVLPEEFMDDETLLYIAKNNPIVFKDLPTNKITKDIAAVLVKSIATPLRYNPFEYKNIFDKIPKDLLDQNEYDILANNYLDLKQIPKKYWSAEAILGSIRRNPMNIRSLHNPEKWIEDHKDIFDSKQHLDVQKLEDAGFLIYGTGKNKNIIDIEDLPKTKLNNGYFILKWIGKNNWRMYLFDKRRNLLGYLYTKNGALHVNSTINFENKAELITEALNYEKIKINTFSPQITDLGIFNHNETFYTRDEYPREEINDDVETTGIIYCNAPEVSRNGNKMRPKNKYSYWFKKNKLIAEYKEVYETGNWGVKGDYSYDLIVYDIPVYLNNTSAFIAISNGNIKNTKLGFVRLGRNVFLAERLIKKTKGFWIFTSAYDKFISIFDKNGLIAYAEMIANGGTGKVVYIAKPENISSIDIAAVLNLAAKKA